MQLLDRLERVVAQVLAELEQGCLDESEKDRLRAAFAGAGFHKVNARSLLFHVCSKLTLYVCIRSTKPQHFRLRSTLSLLSPAPGFSTPRQYNEAGIIAPTKLRQNQTSP